MKYTSQIFVFPALIIEAFGFNLNTKPVQVLRFKTLLVTIRFAHKFALYIEIFYDRFSHIT